MFLYKLHRKSPHIYDFVQYNDRINDNKYCEKSFISSNTLIAHLRCITEQSSFFLVLQVLKKIVQVCNDFSLCLRSMPYNLVHPYKCTAMYFNGCSIFSDVDWFDNTTAVNKWPIFYANYCRLSVHFKFWCLSYTIQHANAIACVNLLSTKYEIIEGEPKYAYDSH